MWYKNVGTNFYRFVIIHLFADGPMDRKALAIPCIAIHAVAW